MTSRTDINANVKISKLFRILLKILNFCTEQQLPFSGLFHQLDKLSYSWILFLLSLMFFLRRCWQYFFQLQVMLFFNFIRVFNELLYSQECEINEPFRPQLNINIMNIIINLDNRLNNSCWHPEMMCHHKQPLQLFLVLSWKFKIKP